MNVGKNTLQGHINTVHKGWRFKCTISGCSESFMWKDQLKFHILGHEGKYRFLCYNWGKGFNHKGNFTAHKDMHTGDKSYKCGRCNAYSTVYPSDLKYHIGTCNIELHIPCTKNGCTGTIFIQGLLTEAFTRKAQKR